MQFTDLEIAAILEAAELTKARLSLYPGVIEVTDSCRGGKPEVELALTSEGRAYGLTLESLGRQVRQGFLGDGAQRIRRERDDLRVMVRYPRQDRSRTINVQAEGDESITTGGEIINALRPDFLPQLLERCPGLSYSLEGNEADYAESMGGLAQGFLVTMFVMQAIPMKSYILPAIILSSVPLGMDGAIWGIGIAA